MIAEIVKIVNVLVEGTGNQSSWRLSTAVKKSSGMSGWPLDITAGTTSALNYQLPTIAFVKR